MAKLRRKPTRFQGYKRSSNPAIWDRNVVRVSENAVPFQAEGLDAFDNPVRNVFLRRQENIISKFERTIPSHKDGNVTTNKRIETLVVDSQDFTANALDAFNATFDHSNRLVCKDMVWAYAAKNHRKSVQKQAKAEMDYLETLEWYNLCRNCKQPIQARGFSENCEDVVERKIELLADITALWIATAYCPAMMVWDIKAFRKTISTLQAELCKLNTKDRIWVADVPAHHEVYWCNEKQGFKYKFVPAKKHFNQKCECVYRDERKKERLEQRIERNSKRLM
jgi:hypothetical protein